MGISWPFSGEKEVGRGEQIDGSRKRLNYIDFILQNIGTSNYDKGSLAIQGAAENILGELDSLPTAIRERYRSIAVMLVKEAREYRSIVKSGARTGSSIQREEIGKYAYVLKGLEQQIMGRATGVVKRETIAQQKEDDMFWDQRFA